VWESGAFKGLRAEKTVSYRSFRGRLPGREAAVSAVRLHSHASDGQKQVLHLWSEFAPLRFFLGEAEYPVQQGADITSQQKLVQVAVLCPAGLVGMDIAVPRLTRE